MKARKINLKKFFKNYQPAKLFTHKNIVWCCCKKYPKAHVWLFSAIVINVHTVNVLFALLEL